MKNDGQDLPYIHTGKQNISVKQLLNPDDFCKAINGDVLPVRCSMQIYLI